MIDEDGMMELKPNPDGWMRTGAKFHADYINWKTRLKVAWRILLHGSIDMEYSMLVKGNAYIDDVRLTLSDEVIARHISIERYQREVEQP